MDPARLRALEDASEARERATRTHRWAGDVYVPRRNGVKLIPSDGFYQTDIIARRA